MNLVKGYNRTILDDLSPYLTSVVELDGISTKPTYKYTFISKNRVDTGKIKNTFTYLVRRYSCWTHPAGGIFAWQTKSTALKDLFEKGLVEGVRRSAVMDMETVEDIPSDMLDASRYIQEYQCEFKQKEKEMSNKFKANYSINISVNGNQITLSDPVNENAALDAVLKLSERLNFLNDQLNTLKELKDTDNVSLVLKAESKEIKKMIKYINDNIKD